MTRSRLPAPLAVLLVVLAGCAGPAVVTASGPAGPDALDCALDEANALGYVVDGAEYGVFVRARRSQRTLFGGNSDSMFDVLTASAPRRRLTVAATAEEITDNGETAKAPSRQAREDAQAIVAVCAD